MTRLCLIEGRPRSSKIGYCGMHHRRFQKHGDPEIRFRRRGIIRDDQGRKMCVRCREWLAESAYGVNKNNADGLGSYCRPCNRTYQRLRKFKITPDGYAAMIAAQGGACAICRTTDPGPKGWHIDHDHKCCEVPHHSAATTCGRCVRGLLCHWCNLSLGGFRDNTETLYRAIAYLEGSLWAQEKSA